MTDVKKFFLDAFHHLGSNRGVPVVDRYAEGGGGGLEEGGVGGRRDELGGSGVGGWQMSKGKCQKSDVGGG